MKRAVTPVAVWVLVLCSLSAVASSPAPAPAGSVPTSLATTVTVSGTVRDAATLWPLYARILVANCGGCPAAWSDPATGAFSLSLPAGFAVTLQVTAYALGYDSASVPIGTLSGDVVQDVALRATDYPCRAPGYRARGGVAEGFETFSLPQGWTIVDNAHTGQGWAFDNPGSRYNTTGGLGGFAVVDSDYYGASGVQNAELRTPSMDFSASSSVSLQFKTEFVLSQSEIADVDVSVHGPAGPWINVWRRTTDLFGPSSVALDITPLAAGQPNVMVRFHYYNAAWAWWWEIDDVVVGPPGCSPPASGGLVVGNVTDGNTGADLPGATVASLDSGATCVAGPTADPAQGDAFYVLFSAAGNHSMVAGDCAFYGTQAAQVTVPNFGTVRRDFTLAAPRLLTDTAGISVSAVRGTSASAAFHLTNAGSLPVHYQILEKEAGAVSSLFPSPFPTPDVACGAGQVLSTWSSRGHHPWGVAYDGKLDFVWLGSPDASWGGEDQLLAFRTDGSPAGSAVPFGWPHDGGPADLAYDWRTGRIWVLNVGSQGGNCVYELDPEAGPTGIVICPGGTGGFNAPQSGLAFDPIQGRFFAAGSADSKVYLFDAAGTLLDQAPLSFPCAGLAYNPFTRHLFAIDVASPTRIHVLNPDDHFAEVGRFAVPGFSDYGGGGLAIDCDGRLWAVDRMGGLVFCVSTGEPGGLCASDVEWLGVDPATGLLDPGASQSVAVTLDARGFAGAGSHEARIQFARDAPYALPDIPVTLTVTNPPLSASASSDRTRGSAPLTVGFAAAASGGDGGPYSFDWDFGDGSSHSPLQNPTHLYSQAGTFYVTLRVADGSGMTAVDSHLSIAAVLPPQVAAVTKAGNPFRLKVSGSNFHPRSFVSVNGVPAPDTVWKSGSLVVAKGDSLKAMVPKGVTVQVRVTNADDGGVSEPFPFTR
jgi:hypothetical protein